MEAEAFQALAEGLFGRLFSGDTERVLRGAGEAFDDLDAMGFERLFEGDAAVREGAHGGEQAWVDADAKGHEFAFAFADDAGGGEGEGGIERDDAGAEGEGGVDDLGVGAKGAGFGDRAAEGGPAGGAAFRTREIYADYRSGVRADALAPQRKFCLLLQTSHGSLQLPRPHGFRRAVLHCLP